MKCHCCDNQTKKEINKHCSSSCAGKCPDALAKRRAGLMAKTGYEHQSKNPAVKEKKKRTLLERYGATSSFLTHGSLAGERNPFFGKKHTKETKLLLRHYEDREAYANKITVVRLYRSVLLRVLMHLKKKKTDRTHVMIGYSTEQFREHIEKLWKSGMTWENHGKGPGTWQVDHIRPIVSFPAIATPSEVNALSNLQPLWWEENMTKGSKWSPEETKEESHD